MQWLELRSLGTCHVNPFERSTLLSCCLESLQMLGIVYISRHRYVWILYPQLRQHGSASKGISGARLSLEGSRGRLQAPSHSHILFLSVHLEHRRNTTHRKPQQLHQHSVAHTVRQSGMTLPKFLLKSLVHSLRFGAVRMIVWPQFLPSFFSETPLFMYPNCPFPVVDN